MKVISQFEITQECLERAAIDVKKLEAYESTHRLTIELMKHPQFHPKKVAERNRGDRFFEHYYNVYEQELHVHTKEQMENVFAKLTVLQSATKNFHVIQMLKDIKTILSL